MEKREKETHFHLARVSAVKRLGVALFVLLVLWQCSPPESNPVPQSGSLMEKKGELPLHPLTANDSLALLNWKNKLAQAGNDSLLPFCDQMSEWLDAHEPGLGHGRWADQKLFICQLLDEAEWKHHAANLCREILTRCRPESCGHSLHYVDALSMVGKNLFYEESNTETAKDTIKLVLDILFSRDPLDSARLAVNLRKYGDICRSAGDFEEAKFCLAATTELQNYTTREEHAATLASKAAVMLEEREYANSRRLNLKAIDSLAVRDKPKAYINIALSYQREGSQVAAIFWFDRAIEEYTRQKTAANKGKVISYADDLAVVYANRGLSYFLIGSSPSASSRNFMNGLASYRQAFDLYNSGLIENQQAYSTALQNVGFYGYQLNGNFQSALEYYHQSLVQLSLDSISPDPLSVPNPENVVSQVEFFNSLWYKGEALSLLAKNLKTSDYNEFLSLTQRALELYKAAFLRAEDQLLKQTGEFMGSQQSQNLFNASKGAIQLCYDLYQETGDTSYVADAFRMAEQSRAHLIQRRIFNNLRLASLSIIDPRAGEIDREIRQINSRLKQELDKSTGVSLMSLLRQRWRLQARLNQMPNPHASIPDKRTSGLNSILQDADIQRLIRQSGEQSEVLVEYFCAGESSFAFVIAKGKLHMVPLPAMDLIENMARNYYEMIKYDPASPDNDLGKIKTSPKPQEILELGRPLFDSLLRPLLGGVKELPKRMTVIPDGNLALLPFEALISSRDHNLRDTVFYRMDFLVRHTAISYQPSASVWLAQQAQDNPGISYSMLGADFNPEDAIITPDKINWDPLPNTVTEVTFAHRQFSGNFLKGSQNSAHNFKRELDSGKYPVVYLALHGQSNDTISNSSRLIFPNPDENGGYELRISEIYPMDLRSTRLAVLSACETALGKKLQGEGVLSFSYAFTSAGCKSVVSTLWVVNDKASADLMISFIKRVVEGSRLDDALQQAKVELMKQGIHSRPFYWAGYVAVGDMRPVEVKQSIWLWIGLATAPTMVFFFLIFRRLKQR